MQGVKEMRLLDQEDDQARVTDSAHLVEQRATASAVLPDSGVSFFERLLRDPSVDVEKLERLMAMHERGQANAARAEYYADFAQMQGELPTVIERGHTNNGAYARHEDIVEVVRPVLMKHGFILTFRTKFEDKQVRVTGVLAHRSGHAEETEFVSAPDTSGNKNAIQALGSAQSYGQRYTARALLNIASREEDDDGRATSKPLKDEPAAPAGYDRWLEALQDVAAEGMPAFAKVWNESKEELRSYLAKTAPKLLAAIRTKAAKAGRA